MPTEYGGEAGTLETIINSWEKRIVSYRDYYKEEEQFGVDEKKRPGAARNGHTDLGTSGSFRQLDFD
jgi:hypothetical protein